MGKALKNTCEFCGKSFSPSELYPIPLLRTATVQTAKRLRPELNEEGFICFPDLRFVHAEYFEEVLTKERGVLSEFEQDVIDSIKDQELLSENVNEEFEETLSVGERMADRLAEFGGSWRFIGIFVAVLFLWMGINSVQLFRETFDPYPFIFLNLILSCLAAIQAPVIMMSQNRTNAKDRLKMEHDFKVNLKAELQIRQINARLEMFMRHHWQKMHEFSRQQEELLQEILEEKRINRNVDKKGNQ